MYSYAIHIYFGVITPKYTSYLYSIALATQESKVYRVQKSATGEVFTLFTLWACPKAITHMGQYQDQIKEKY